MINILLPVVGQSIFFKDYYFPKLMLEINDETILEKVVKNYNTIKDKHFIFIFNHKECVEFHLDESARLITEPENTVITLKNNTGGALCTCLLAVKEINNDSPLIIANSDQLIDVNYQDVVNYFDNNGYDAGVITFPSIHPRWSYIRLDNENIVEIAEKRPLSKHAIAGFYYFKHGSDFVNIAKKTIMKENSLNGVYYIAPALNELILTGKKVGYYEVEKNKYHSFYSPEKIGMYEGVKDV